VSSITIIILVLGILIIVAVAAFVLYKAGFKVDKIKAMLPGVMEMEASRPQSPPASPAQAADQANAPASQEGIVISGNVQRGRDHKIEVGRGGNIQVTDNLQEGAKDEIRVTPDKKKRS
jgi:hypothetical protein